MNILTNICTVSEAEAALAEQGIVVDTVYRDVITGGFCYGVPRDNHGIHVYFNQGRSNLAYFTPALETLSIFDAPRADAMCGEKHFLRRPTASPAPAVAVN